LEKYTAPIFRAEVHMATQPKDHQHLADYSVAVYTAEVM
jgi:hypothetical protein